MIKVKTQPLVPKPPGQAPISPKAKGTGADTKILLANKYFIWPIDKKDPVDSQYESQTNL